MIILLYGSDTYRSRQHLRKLGSSFQEKHDARGFSVQRHQAAELNADTLQRAVATNGLFATKTFVVIEGLFESARQELQDIVLNSLKTLTASPDIILVFWESFNKPARKNKLFDQLASSKLARKFEPLNPLQLKDWLRKSFAAAGALPQAGVLELLQQQVGNDLWQLDQEVQKLVNFSADNTVTLQDTRRLLPVSFQEKAFELTDALAGRQVERAIYILEEQWKLGHHPLVVLGSIIWQFRNIIMIKEGVENREQLESIARKLHLHPFVVKKSWSVVNNFDWKHLQYLYQSLQKMDRAFKTGEGNPRAWFSLFVVKACA